MARCLECAYANPDGHAFCGRCGLRLAGGPGRCAECSRVVGARDKFCPDCGAALAAEARPVPAPPAAPAPEARTPARPSPNATLVPGGPPPAEDPAQEVPTLAMRAPLRLKVVAGRELDKVHVIPGDGGIVGRHEDADVLLEGDAYVNDEHARLLRTNEGVFVEDLGSVNGTFVKARGRTALKTGDEIKVGQTLLRLEK